MCVFALSLISANVEIFGVSLMQIFLLDKVLELVGRGSVINGSSFPNWPPNG